MFNSLPRNRLTPSSRTCEYTPTPTLKSTEEETSTASSTQSTVHSVRMSLLRLRALGLGLRHTLHHRLVRAIRSTLQCGSAVSRLPVTLRTAYHSLLSRHANDRHLTLTRLPTQQSSISNSASSTPVHAVSRPAAVANRECLCLRLARYWNTELFRLSLQVLIAFGLAATLAGIALLWSLFVLELRAQPLLFMAAILLGAH